MSKFDVFVQGVRESMGMDSISRDDLTLDSSKPTKADISTKDQVVNAILKRGVEVTEEHLPDIMEEMKAYFAEYKNGDYFADLKNQDYYRLLDFRDNENARVVVVGDIHCDYYSLAALLLKLSVSEYDYFENAYFVFLGDYLDRGSALFEPLLLLIDLKRILGNRLIMLRGNHELISYNKEKQELESRVLPQQSCPCLNEYCGTDKKFLEDFGYFYKTLPTYVYLKIANQNILLTHAAVPRMKFFDIFHFDQTTGAIEFDTNFEYEQFNLAKENTFDDKITSMQHRIDDILLNYRKQILYDMIWGDPSHDKEKYQVSGRFEFGSDQFEAYAVKNNISRLFRSHEPISKGFESFYGNRLYTIFSTGGNMNNQAGYADVEPAFAVIKEDGTCMLENSYTFQVVTGDVVVTVNNLFSDKFLVAKQRYSLPLNNEFVCSEEKALYIEAVYEKLKKGFEPQEEVIKDEKTDDVVENGDDGKIEEPVVVEEESTKDETDDLKEKIEKEKSQIN